MAPKAKSSKAKAPKESAGFMGWDDADDADDGANFKQGKIAQPLDKRNKQVEVKEEKIITGGSDAASMLLKKQALVKKDDKAKKAADQKVKDSVKAARQGQGEDDLGGDGGDDEDAFQILDKSGLGNFMDKADVLEIMKNTVAEAVTSSGNRSQIVTKISAGERVYLGDAKKAPIFESVGDFKTNKGFIYVRGKQDEPGFGLKLQRPCTIYACLSEPPNEDDSYMRRWEVVPPDVFRPPDVGDGLAEIAVIKKKKFTDRMGSIPKPPEGYETCLCFIVPDFHAEPFGKEELSKEEQLVVDRKNKAAARDERDKEKAEKDQGKTDKKKDEPSEEENVAAIKEKVEAGTKLTSKEKKALEKWKEKHPTYEVHAEDRSLVDSSLNAFSVVIEGGCNPPPAGDSLVVESFSLQAPGQHLFVNANFTIAQGKRYGILGPNGQGKTTLLRHIAAREFPVPVNWDVILVEQEAKASNKSAVEEVMASNEAMFKLGQLEQELIDKLDKASEAAERGEGAMSAEECETVQQELSRISAELEASGADSAEAQVRKILCGLGFTNGGGKVGSVTDRFSMDRAVEQFSGGWRMRISLAKALYLCPKLLMLDEPTNHLDLDAVLWLDDYLSTKYPHAIIVVSHDADFLDNICTDILHLENKQLLHYRGDYTAFRKMHEQKARETASIYKRQQDELKALKKKGTSADDALAKIKTKYKIHSLDDLMEKPKDYLVKFNFRGHGMDQSIGGVNVTEVAFSYNGKEPWLLEDCEMGVDCASRIAIVGPNGAGKTTMLNLMLCQLEPSKGEVAIAKGLRVKNYHQHFEELLPFEKDPTTHLRDMYNLNPEKARAILGQFGLPGASHHTKIGNLSGGQKARVAFGELMLSEPHIMILDEPTNHLDIESVEALTKAITNFNGGLVIVSHDARLITEIDAEIWVVEEGTCYRFEKGFDGYRDKVLRQLEERQAEVERLEKVRRDAKAAKRAALVTKEQAEAAKKKAEEEKKAEEAAQAALLKKAQAEAVARAAEEAKKPKKQVVDEPIAEGSDEDSDHAKKDDSADRSDAESDKDDSEDESDIDYDEKHPEFKVAMLVSVRVKKVNVGKKDKEFKVFLCELDIGEDDNISAVTVYANAMAGEKVIVALVGATVEDAKVTADMVHGEYNQAVICGPKEMGWTVAKSDMAKCTILDDSLEVGDFAPLRGSVKVQKEKADEDEDAKDKAEAKAAPQKTKAAPGQVTDAKAKKGKKVDEGNDDDNDDDDDDGADALAAAEAEKKKKKGKPGKGEDDVKVGRSAAKKAQAEKEEAEKKEKADAAAKAKGKKGKNQAADEDNDVPMEKAKPKKDVPEAAKQDASGGDPNAKHPEYKVAKVVEVEPLKKAGKFIRGSFVVSISLGDDDSSDKITVVTTYELSLGNRVVYASEGSTVSGKEVKKSKVQGEWSFGVFCTPMELSWPGDAGKCVLLSEAWKVGDLAPLNAPKDLGVIAVDEPDEEDNADEEAPDEDDEVDYAELNDKKKSAAKAKAAPKAKGKAAKGKRGKKGDIDDDSDQDDAAADAKPKAKAEPKPKGAPPAPKAKARGKKGKKGDSDEEFGNIDVPAPGAKKVAAAKVDSDSDGDRQPLARKGGFAKGGFAAMMDSDDENADSESEEEVKPPPKKEPPAPVAKGKSKKDESGDSDSDEDDKAAKKKAAAKEKDKAKAKKKVEVSDEESSDEEEKKAAVARKKALEKLKEKAKGKKKKASSSEDESSEDEKAKKKKKAAKEKEKAKAKKKKESSSDEESLEDEKAKKKKAVAKEKEKAKAKKKKESSSEEESSEDDKAKKKKAAAKEKEKADKEKAKAKKKKDGSDDDGGADFDFGAKKKDKKKKADDDSDDDKKKKKEKKDKK